MGGKPDLARLQHKGGEAPGRRADHPNPVAVKLAHHVIDLMGGIDQFTDLI